MTRRSILSDATVALTLVIGVGILAVGGAATAGAAGLAITGSGYVDCTTTAGTVKFKPALTLGSTATTRMRVSVSASGCGGMGDGTSVTSIKVKGTLSAAAGWCLRQYRQWVPRYWGPYSYLQGGQGHAQVAPDHCVSL